MGRDKASLPFGDETLLARVMRLVAEVVPREQIVLVAAAEQQLPPLPWEAKVIRDREADQGPLPALIDGIAALPANVSAAFVTACDAPWLQAALIEMLFGAIEPKVDAAVPSDGERLHPLTAVYRLSCLTGLRAYRDGGRSSLQGVLQSLGGRLKELPVEQLRRVDPELRSLLSCNTPEEYQAVLGLLVKDDADA